MKGDVVNVFRLEIFIFPILIARNDPARVQVIMIIERLGGERNEAFGVEDSAAIIRPATAKILASGTDQLDIVEPGETGTETAIRNPIELLLWSLNRSTIARVLPGVDMVSQS